MVSSRSLKALWHILMFLANSSFHVLKWFLFQAFSHFSFERSGHQLIVVDIQGVGDLYTDPQIHTACGTGYGEGNLGAKGMALFFASHKCNQLCKDLGLAAFDLSPLEERRIDEVLSSSEPSTKLRDSLHFAKRKMSAMFDLVERLSDHSSHGNGSDTSSNPDSMFSGSVEDISSPRSFSDDLSSCGSFPVRLQFLLILFRHQRFCISFLIDIFSVK